MISQVLDAKGGAAHSLPSGCPWAHGVKTSWALVVSRPQGDSAVLPEGRSLPVLWLFCTGSIVTCHRNKEEIQPQSSPSQ